MHHFKGCYMFYESCESGNEMKMKLITGKYMYKLALKMSDQTRAYNGIIS